VMASKTAANNNGFRTISPPSANKLFISCVRT
jgi:hypothetical protein